MAEIAAELAYFVVQYYIPEFFVEHRGKFDYCENL